MRHIVAVLIALLVTLPLILSAGAQTTTTNQTAPLAPRTVSQTLPAETGLYTTESIAAFLSDSWRPPAYRPPVETALAASRNGTLANATSYQSQFLNESYVPGGYDDPVEVAETANKFGVIQQSGLAILDFLDDSWTPSLEPQPVYIDSAGYKMHEMS